MKKVYKYNIDEVPKRANIVHFGVCPATKELAVWAEIEDGKLVAIFKHLCVLGTGELIDDCYIHRGSTIQDNTYVWHLYEYR